MYKDKFEDQFKNFQSYLKMSSTNNAKYSCELCRYQTCKKRHLTLHEQAVHKGKKFQCPVCECHATKKNHLVAHHKSVHLGGKFKCPDWDYQVTQKDYFVTHKQLVHMAKLQSSKWTHQSLGI